MRNLFFPKIALLIISALLLASISLWHIWPVNYSMLATGAIISITGVFVIFQNRNLYGLIYIICGFVPFCGLYGTKLYQEMINEDFRLMASTPVSLTRQADSPESSGATGSGATGSGATGSGATGSGATGSGVSSSERSHIKIKGLYIGMDIQTVAEIIHRQLPNGHTHKFDEVEKSLDGGFVLVLPWFSMCKAEQNGRVSLILLQSILVDDLFNSSDMQASDFTQQFVDSYDIPEMSVHYDGNWTYTSPEGVKVTINTRKSITLEKVASEQERTFD